MNVADVRYYEALRNIGDVMQARYIITKTIDYYFAEKMRGYDTDDMIKRLKMIREKLEKIEEDMILYPTNLEISIFKKTT